MKIRDEAVTICPREGNWEVKEGQSQFKRVYCLPSQPFIWNLESMRTPPTFGGMLKTNISPEQKQNFIGRSSLRWRE